MTEIPLLRDDLFGRAVRRRLSNVEFLKAVARWLQKMKLYPTHGQGLIEDEANLLLPLLGCSQPGPPSALKADSMGKSESSEVTSTVAIRPRSIQCEPGSVPAIVRSELTILFRTLLFPLKAGVFGKGKRGIASPLAGCI
jgi:hypothetical protein